MIRIAYGKASVSRNWKNNNSNNKWSTRLPNQATTRSTSSTTTSTTTEPLLTRTRRSVKVYSSLHHDDKNNNNNNLQNDSSASCCVDYARSWAWQHILLSRRLSARRRVPSNQEDRNQEDRNHDDDNDDDDSVLLLEHSPVYTLGRGADEAHLTFLNNSSSHKDDDHHHQESRRKLSRKHRGPGTARLAVDKSSGGGGNDEHSLSAFSLLRSLPDAVDQLLTQQMMVSPVLAPNGVPIYRVERGGEVTFHGPKQLVVYPLLDLQRPPLSKDLHWYLRSVEEVVLQTLSHYGIEGIRDEKNTGVWVGEEKVAAVGISSSRWITTHGFAINVDPDLTYFDTSVILPCGIQGKGVTSMGKLLREQGSSTPVPSVQEVSNVVVGVMEQVWGVRLEHAESVR